MRIQTFEWEMFVNEAVPNKKRHLSLDALDVLKRHFLDLMKQIRCDSLLVIRMKQDRYISFDQAKAFSEVLEKLDNKICVQSLTKKQLVVSNQSGATITVILACGTSNFDTSFGDEDGGAFTQIWNKEFGAELDTMLTDVEENWPRGRRPPSRALFTGRMMAINPIVTNQQT